MDIKKFSDYKLNEGLVHQHSLDQLLSIQKELDKIGDIGRKFTDDVEDFYDYHNDTDLDTDSAYDVSNQIQKTTYSKDQDITNFITKVGQGNLGECIGDLTQQEYANNYWEYNPLTSFVDTIEEFDLSISQQNNWYKGAYSGKDPQGINKTKNKKPKRKKKMVKEGIQIIRFTEFVD